MPNNRPSKLVKSAKQRQPLTAEHLSSLTSLKTYATEANAYAAVEKYAPCLERTVVTAVMMRNLEGRVVPVLFYQGSTPDRWGPVQSSINAAQSGFIAYA